MNKSLDEKYAISQIYSSYSVVLEIKKCINEFREIFRRKNMPFLYSFIENYSKSSISAIRSFAHSLEKDINAVENAVASDFSNGFVEGMNNRTKVIKRTMYGRCGHKLLSAKIMLGSKETDNCGRTQYSIPHWAC